MDIDRAYEGLIKKVRRGSKRILNNMNFKGYLNVSQNSVEIQNCCKEYYSINLITNLKLMRMKRRIIIHALDGINYRRGKKDEWTGPAVIYFMDAVIRLYMNDNSLKPEAIHKREVSISNKFNVPINRLKTQVALFLNNYDKGRDNFDIDAYFNKLEIVAWKYRDKDKLYKLVEKDKLSEEERDIIKEIYNI